MKLQNTSFTDWYTIPRATFTATLDDTDITVSGTYNVHSNVYYPERIDDVDLQEWATEHGYDWSDLFDLLQVTYEERG